MQRLVRIGPWLLALVLVAVVVLAWARPRPELEPADAAAVAVGALASQGFEAAIVGTPVLATFAPDAAEPDVWDVVLSVGDDQIEVKVQRDVGELAFIDDNIGPAAAPRQLLTDDQVAAIDDYRDDSVVDDLVQENIGFSVAAAIAFVVAMLVGRARIPGAPGEVATS